MLMADRIAMSVGDLFLGAVFPGLVLTSLYIIYIILFGLLQSEKQQQLKNNLVELICTTCVDQSCLPLFLIVAVLGSIFFGIATPTEAAGVGACGALLLTFINKKFESSMLKEVLQETTRTTAFIFAILLGATAFFFGTSRTGWR